MDNNDIEYWLKRDKRQVETFIQDFFAMIGRNTSHAVKFTATVEFDDGGVLTRTLSTKAKEKHS